MHFRSPLLAVLSLFLLVGFCQASVGPTCTEMKEDLSDKPDIVLKKFETHVCEKGCKFTAHGGAFRKKVMHPAISQALKEMGMSSHESAALHVADDVAKRVRKECLAKKGDICQDHETFAEFGKCAKANVWPVVDGKLSELMPLVSEPSCKKEKRYLEKPHLYEEVLPRWLDRYAATCKKH